MASILETIRTVVRRKGPNAEALAKALEAAKAELATAKSRLAELLADGSAALGSDDEWSANQSALTTARGHVARLEAAIPALEAALEISKGAAAEAERRALYDKAISACAEARSLLTNEYEPACQKLRVIARKVAEAQLAALAANKSLPQGVSFVPDPEVAVRDLPSRAGNVVVERREAAWTFTDRKFAIANAQPKPFGAGHVIERAGELLPVVRHSFTVRKVLDDQMGQLGPRIADLNLPALTYAERDFFRQRPFGQPAQVLAEATAERPPAPKSESGEPHEVWLPDPVHQLDALEPMLRPQQAPGEPWIK